jgi:hypothetical protein
LSSVSLHNTSRRVAPDACEVRTFCAGSFWLNPPLPMDADGNWVNPPRHPMQELDVDLGYTTK